MHKSKYAHALVFAAGFVLVSIFVLWSWNTLAELFAGPQAEYRHALAATGMWALLGWMLGGGRHRPRHARCRQGEDLADGA